VSVLQIDHVPIKGKLFGVWQALYRRGVLGFKEVNRCGTRAPNTCCELIRLPSTRRPSVRGAPVIRGYTAEGAVKALQKSRCVPEFESVQVSA
jgi:hypothetical protein